MDICDANTHSQIWLKMIGCMSNANEAYVIAASKKIFGATR